MDLKVFKEEMEKCLTGNILSFWIDNMQDTEHGGFYGQMLSDGTLVPTADKGAILNARLLWAFSAAYRIQGNPLYLQMATRTKNYIINYFIDKEYGGCYWSLDYLGNPKDTKKQFYAIGFMLYGFTEYYRATHDAEALKISMEIFDCIEKYGWDSEYGGYIEAANRDWSPIADMRLSKHDQNYPKSQNTHLHIIEPYTNLLRCVKNERVELAVRKLITIFVEKILNSETFHLDVFFNMDWTRGNDRIESYGHDIEVSWLLQEAAEVLGDKEVLDKVLPVVRKVAEASEKGLTPDGSMIHEANLSQGNQDPEYEWWVLAEAVVGFFNVGKYDIVERIWNYIKQHFIDYEGGEWWWSCFKDGTPNMQEDKAGFWKCPYHNGRMCIEIIERLNNQKY